MCLLARGRDNLSITWDHSYSKPQTSDQFPLANSRPYMFLFDKPFHSGIRHNREEKIISFWPWLTSWLCCQIFNQKCGFRFQIAFGYVMEIHGSSIFEEYCWSVHPRTLAVECVTHDLLISAHKRPCKEFCEPFNGPVFFGKGKEGGCSNQGQTPHISNRLRHGKLQRLCHPPQILTSWNMADKESFRFPSTKRLCES